MSPFLDSEARRGSRMKKVVRRSLQIWFAHKSISLCPLPLHYAHSSGVGTGSTRVNRETAASSTDASRSDQHLHKILWKSVSLS